MDLACEMRLASTSNGMLDRKWLGIADWPLPKGGVADCHGCRCPRQCSEKQRERRRPAEGGSAVAAVVVLEQNGERDATQLKRARSRAFGRRRRWLLSLRGNSRVRSQGCRPVIIFGVWCALVRRGDEDLGCQRL